MQNFESRGGDSPSPFCGHTVNSLNGDTLDWPDYEVS